MGDLRIQTGILRSHPETTNGRKPPPPLGQRAMGADNVTRVQSWGCLMGSRAVVGVVRSVLECGEKVWGAGTSKEMQLLTAIWHGNMGITVPMVKY